MYFLGQGRKGGPGYWNLAMIFPLIYLCVTSLFPYLFFSHLPVFCLSTKSMLYLVSLRWNLALGFFGVGF